MFDWHIFVVNADALSPALEKHGALTVDLDLLGFAATAAEVVGRRGLDDVEPGGAARLPGDTRVTREEEVGQTQHAPNTHAHNRKYDNISQRQTDRQTDRHTHTHTHTHTHHRSRVPRVTHTVFPLHWLSGAAVCRLCTCGPQFSPWSSSKGRSLVTGDCLV